MQGFFVKATANSSVYLPRDARTHDTDQMRYKKGSEVSSGKDSISFVRLKLHGVADSADLVVRFNANATTGFDRAFDAYEFSRTTGDLNIWSTSGGIDFSINGLSFPEEKIEIPVGVNVKMPGTFRLASNEINKLDIYNISLKDLSTNQTVDLNKGEYIEFTAPAGMITGRFILVMSKSSTPVIDIPVPGKKFNIYSTPGRTINIRSLSDETFMTKGSIMVYDNTGRKVLHRSNIEWGGNGDLKQFVLNSATTGLYLVVVETGTGKFIEKVTLK
jgi:hypothetical protein